MVEFRSIFCIVVVECSEKLIASVLMCIFSASGVQNVYCLSEKLLPGEQVTCVDDDTDDDKDRRRTNNDCLFSLC